MTTLQTKDKRKWWVLFAAIILYLATTADGPNLNAALPTIQDDFSASAAQIQLLTTVAQLCVAAFVLAVGALGDLHGRKCVFLTGGLGLLLSLALLAISPSIDVLTFIRGLDGVFSIITTPLAVALITMEFLGKGRSMALGIFTAVVGLSEAFLPLLTGWLADTVGWRSTFLISISTAALAYLIICKYAQVSKDPNAQKLDMGGVTFSAILLGFVGSFLLAGNRGFSNPAVLIAIAVGLIFLLIFIAWKGSTLSMPRVQI